MFSNIVYFVSDLEEKPCLLVSLQSVEFQGYPYSSLLGECQKQCNVVLLLILVRNEFQKSLA